MTAFINGALAALEKVLLLLDNLEEESGQDPKLDVLRHNIEMYINMYKTLDSYRKEKQTKINYK